jgi:hypothetical protein
MSTADLIQQTRARFNSNYQKLQLLEKYESKLIVAYKNGLWKIDQTLIGTLNAFTDSDIVLLDMYKTPIRVDRNELLTLSKNIFSEVMSQWHEEYNAIDQ